MRYSPLGHRLPAAQLTITSRTSASPWTTRIVAAMSSPDAPRGLGARTIPMAVRTNRTAAKTIMARASAYTSVQDA